jgi:hypothetical protein
MLRSLGLPELLVLIVLVAMLVPFWRIFNKLGFPGWLSLFMYVPLLNTIILFYVAFAKPKPK